MEIVNQSGDGDSDGSCNFGLAVCAATYTSAESQWSSKCYFESNFMSVGLLFQLLADCCFAVRCLWAVG